MLLVVVMTLTCLTAFSDEIIMSAPPRESQQEAEALYKPLADKFTEILGRPVRYVYPGNWFTYQRQMRKGHYDIAFDGPHFASWRIKHLAHEVLVKLNGSIKFVALAHKTNKSVSSLSDLVGKKICSVSPPNLSALIILHSYKNPVQQPILRGIKGGMANVISKFNAGGCDAAVIRSSYYKKKLDLDERNTTKIIYRSIALPNQAFTVSKKLSAADIAKLVSAIEYGAAKNIIRPIAKRFGGEQASFLAADTTEYRDQRLLLEGVIFGW